MEKIGISFRSSLPSEKIGKRFIHPLRRVLSQARQGIYSNHLRHVDPDSEDPTEHLLVFEVNDFKEGLRVLRVELEKIGLPPQARFHNLNPSQPSY